MASGRIGGGERGREGRGKESLLGLFPC